MREMYSHVNYNHKMALEKEESVPIFKPHKLCFTLKFIRVVKNVH